MGNPVARPKENLMLLVHRIPFPPNKGDKIRSYHLLKYLTQHYTVHLGTFVDDENDLQYIETVKQLCGESCFLYLNPMLAKLKSITALLANRPLSLDYYRSAAMRSWVRSVIKEKAIKKIVVFSSAMAQFVEAFPETRRVIDFVDVDSDKWLQYASKKVWPMSWLYHREAQTLLAYEKNLANGCDAALFVSQAEADLFKRLAPESTDKIGFFNNGVDVDYFSPGISSLNPYSPKDRVIVFTGAMDYWPNIDAVHWFSEQVFPAVRKQYQDALFYIVGTRPSEKVLQLANLPGVRVTGSVPDVRPYLAHADIVVAPLRIARGIQNKVLEAMAMAKTVVVSPQALEGIDALPGQELLVADNAIHFSTILLDLLMRENESIGIAARKKVETRYNWNDNLKNVDASLRSFMSN
ncbi:MAG: TIGR03087 family PEP-CTERM/XrtA system glycosyltransferase [Undibacterium sp.]|uniref:TIGR03087 family PEP-CTERM/XrtA system glycosyltransferase n=1 Tax=Undibacterium sp. TaxID=1914977 RepID=UPI002717D994|nr:TIGR03087 family PEP-CTERM/XrtA system glycosyltransferase [Undibacterium sp.]MDO8651346.1 TIGR03087 family PEP-CTERM/XrtA system glycosyltransferase [Undibacterium sp.]